MLPLTRVISKSAAGYLLENPSIRRYAPRLMQAIISLAMVLREKATDADNQQERPGFAQWVVGFVDGEGCFSVPIFRSRSSRSGWQVQPAFSVVQGEWSLGALHLLKRYFECGSVVRNARHDNHREDVWRYGVRRLEDLSNRIIPFFELNPLITAKSVDFEHLSSVVRMMSKGIHLEDGGLAKIATIAEAMNQRKPSRFLESSEAIRQPSRFDNETKRWS